MRPVGSCRGTVAQAGAVRVRLAMRKLTFVVLASVAVMSGCRTLIGNPFNPDGTPNGSNTGSSNGSGNGGVNGNGGASGTIDGNGGGEVDANGCLRASCIAQGFRCGFIDDGCGGQLDCSTSALGEKCGNGTVCDAISHTCVVCIAKTCESEGKTCGIISDGCGGTLNCTQIVSGGMGCPTGTTCGGGGVPGQCGCRKATCQELNARCGTVSDGCGGTLDCTAATGGGCGAGQECDTATNQCFIPNCTPLTCAQLGNPCGLVSDGCGRTIACSQCPSGQLCDAVTNTCLAHAGDGAPNFGLPSAACGERVCGRMVDACGYAHDCGSSSACGGGTVCKDNQCTACTPLTVCPPRRCGAISNGCGGTLVCGNGAQSPAFADVCDTGEVCDQQRGVCVDPSPTTCAAQGRNCGFASDGVGGLIDCGTCTAPETCGGAGTSGVCGLNAANRACLAANLKCGFAKDACGNSFECGNCDQGTQKCSATLGVCEQCPPRFTCAANYPGQCGAALSDGCNGTIDCSGTCAPGNECNTTTFVCEPCVNPCLADPLGTVVPGPTGGVDSPPGTECNSVASCGTTINNCGQKSRCSQTYACDVADPQFCTSAPGVGGGLTCVNNQCCRRDSEATTCGNGALCGTVVDNCGIPVSCSCSDTPNDQACQTASPNSICVNCENLCDTQTRECGNPSGVGTGAGNTTCTPGSCGTCAPGQTCDSAGACCDTCANRYYGAVIGVTGLTGGTGGPPAGPYGNRAQCGVLVDLDPTVVGPSGLTGAVCSNGTCTACPAGGICTCDPASNSPHPCGSVGNENGEIGACLSCADVCIQYRATPGNSNFCGTPPGFPGSCDCGCALPDVCVTATALAAPGQPGTCCSPQPNATTCSDETPTPVGEEYCGGVINNCFQNVTCTCGTDAPGPNDQFCLAQTGPDVCRNCDNVCVSQNRECGVPTPAGNPETCSTNACGVCATNSSCSGGACCVNCGTIYPNGAPGVSGIGSVQRCGVGLDRNPGGTAGAAGVAGPSGVSGGVNPSCGSTVCGCPGGSTCFCDVATDPHQCATPGDAGEGGYCLNCAQINLAYANDNPGYCGVVPGTSCPAIGCPSGNACVGNVCTSCATLCANKECGTANGCDCGTCPAGSACSTNPSTGYAACCVNNCSFFYNQSPSICDSAFPPEQGVSASPAAFGTATTCTAGNLGAAYPGTLDCDGCNGNNCVGGVCQCAPEPVSTTCGSDNNNPTNGNANSICEVRTNNCGQTINCDCAGGDGVVCGAGDNQGASLCCRTSTNPDRCCAPRSEATACGTGPTHQCGDIQLSDNCGGLVTCNDPCTGTNTDGVNATCFNNACCLPRTKAVACGNPPVTCGGATRSDGCGGTIVCDNPCVGATTTCYNNQCCTPLTENAACGSGNSEVCGTTTRNDNCGGTIDCLDDCDGARVCYQNACCDPTCGPNECGTKTKCGQTVDCLGCSDAGGPGGTCNGGLCCQASTCSSAYNNRCGTFTDNCGGNVSCACSGIEGCSATNCVCPSPDAAATLPAVQSLCSGRCQQTIRVDSNGSGGLQVVSPSGPCAPNGSCPQDETCVAGQCVRGCLVNCNDCPNGGG
jgi:hypothetical protein